MLVLTRKRDEMIKIGSDIVIKVIHTGKGTVKLGIVAPPHVRVLRAELELDVPFVETAADTESDGEDDDGETGDPENPSGMTAERFLTELEDLPEYGQLTGRHGVVAQFC